MFEKRLTPENNWLTILPIIITLLIVVWTLSTAMTPGEQPREAVFDLFMRMKARDAGPVVKDRFVIVDIDQESVERVGPWPWPRTQLAELVSAASKAGATNVVLTVPVEGPDPLSPEIVGRYWFNRGVDASSEIASAVANLPSHDVALAQSLTGLPAAVVIAESPFADLHTGQGWARTSFENADWASVLAGRGNEADSFALPVSAPKGALAQDISAVARVTVSAIPADPDGIVRRARLVWNAYDQPVPATSLGALLINDSKVVVQPHATLLQPAGHPVSVVTIDGTDITLDRQSSAIIYMPQNVSVPTIPAWRAISGNESWRLAMRGRTVFIGESITGGSKVMTARGEMTKTQVHALMADQIADGVSISRPKWAGLAEASLALILGVGAIISILVFSGIISATGAFVTSVLLLVIAWIVFANGGILLDPVPAILAIVGSQFGFAVSSLGASVLRDDAVRGAFHGALPPTAMATLQKNKNSGLLDGVRRQVTVLSCSIRLPDDLVAEFVNKPNEYVAFRAQTNDKLRQTILALGGTVDHGEDGRQLGYWNVPEQNTGHIEQACSCALQMIEDMNVLAQDLESSQSARPMARIADENEGSAFERGHLEIGISSDVCFSGPVGRGARNRYSVIGPSVTLAGRLRDRSRLYGPAIICDDTVFTALRHHFAFLDLDTLRINNAPQPRQVYGLVGNPFLKASKTFRRMADTQRELVNAWRDGNLPETKAYLQQLEDLPGTHDAFLRLYKDRLHHAELEKQSSGNIGDNWDGSQQIYI